MLVFHTDLAGAISQKELLYFAETRAVSRQVEKEYLITSLLEEENLLSSLIAEGQPPGESLKRLARSDLSALFARTPDPLFEGYAPSALRTAGFAEYDASLKMLLEKKDESALLEGLLDHYRAFGGGKEARFLACKWQKGALRGISKPDFADLSSLFCLERQKEELQANVEAFLEKKPFRNVLLYGNSGCGKSSMTKALLFKYYRRGLRLVQISKEDLEELPALLEVLSSKQFFYLVFMDDLSFEEGDGGYKSLKVVLEGGAAGQSPNILFCATSNRRHLVSESFAERQGSDVHAADTMNEKLSLAERFGLRIAFFTPSQNDYLKIVSSLLEKEGLPFNEQTKQGALHFATLAGGRSGRTARQFVSSLLAKK
ncbi:MAG: ATP-binding protein [Clostridia bacterium]|nr:ATP-binding protein [Clostridia bacterium]